MEEKMELREKNERKGEDKSIESSQISDESVLSDTEKYDHSDSSNLLLETAPEVEKMCQIMTTDPEAFPKHLSKLVCNQPFVFKRIVDDPVSYIDLLGHNKFDDIAGNELVDAIDKEAVDRLLAKGFDEEFTMQVYQACNFNESGAAELLNYLQ